MKRLIGWRPRYADAPDSRWVLASMRPSDEMSSETSSFNRPSQELAQRLTEWVSILCDRNATACSGVPIRLYRNATSRSRKRVKSPAHRKHLQAGYMGKSGVWARQTEDVEEVDDHPALDLLWRPNGVTPGGAHFAYQRFFDREWSGSAFIQIVGDKEPTALLRMAPQITRVVLDRTYFIGGYVYGADASVEQRFSPDEVMYSYLHPSPFRPWLGWTWVQSVIMHADRFAASTLADYALWTRGGRPEYAIKLPQGTTEKQIKLFRETIEAHHSRPHNAGKPYIGVAEEIQVLGWSPRDLEGVASRADARDIMAAAAGVPESEYRISESNYSNSREGSRQYFERTVIPRLVSDADALTCQLLPRYGVAPGEMWFAYDNPIQEDVEAESRRVSLLFTSGLVTQNEARQLIGLDEAEGGERYVWESAVASAEPTDTEDDMGEDETDDEKPSEPPPGKSRHPGYYHCDHAEGMERKDRIADPYVEAIQSTIDKWYRDMGAVTRRQAASGQPDAVSTDAAALENGLRPTMQVSMLDAARKAFDAIDGAQQDAFRVVPAAVVRYIDGYVPRLATAISDETTASLREAMRLGLSNGETVGQMQDRVAEALGIEADYRSERIARTEAASLTTKGNIQGWTAAGVTRKKWLLAPNPCPICASIAKNNPNPIPIGEPFYGMGAVVPGTGFVVNWEPIMGAPSHPNCRCDTIPVVQ